MEHPSASESCAECGTTTFPNGRVPYPQGIPFTTATKKRGDAGQLCLDCDQAHRNGLIKHDPDVPGLPPPQVRGALETIAELTAVDLDDEDQMRSSLTEIRTIALKHLGTPK